MKLIYFSFLTILLFSSCTKDEENLDLANNGWRVILFSEDGKDQTASFSGYIFDFQNTGNVTAVKGAETVKGVWKEVVDSGRTKFILSFSKAGIFDEISEDWTLVTKNDSVIKLTHNSGSAASIGADILEFGK